ncbi:MAG: flagellar basal body P-ring formation chaperone FlgA [Campylobacter sp.]|nr:flagellar basal body P-ring formation chaperone FlgA [Campylobacter sp.]
MYCVDSQYIRLSTFGFEGEDNEILDLKTRKAAKIEMKNLSEILKANFKSFTDKSGGYVAFVRNCSNLDHMQERFLQILADKYPQITVERLEITPQNTLDSDFELYKFDSIASAKILKSKGSFRANFESGDFSLKTIPFRYKFRAKMPVLVSLKQIEQKHMLSFLDYTTSQVDFDEYNHASLRVSGQKLISKTVIKSGEILLSRHFEEINLVRKGDKLNAIIQDGGLNIITEVSAMQSGNLGDTIRVKSKDNKSYQATITSPKEVVIR